MMSLTGLARGVATLFTAMLTSACCVSLPRVAERRSVPLPTPPESFDVVTSATVWRDERRGRDVPVKFYAPAGRVVRNSSVIPSGARDLGGRRRENVDVRPTALPDSSLTLGMTTKEVGASARLPVVLFSHGIGEDRESYEWLGRALAAAGFLSVHVTHAGTDRAMLERGYRHLYNAVKDPQNWVNRTLDVTFVLDQLESDKRADMDRVAVAGHSAGAFTAFSVAGLKIRDGAPPRDPRVKAIIPMSMPKMEGVVPEGGYDDVRIPVLNMTGTCDTSILYRTFPRHRRIPFESTTATGHNLVTIRGVNHDTFSARSDKHQPLIAAISIAFLRAFVLGNDEAAAWFGEARHEVVRGTELTVERK